MISALIYLVSALIDKVTALLPTGSPIAGINITDFTNVFVMIRNFLGQIDFLVPVAFVMSTIAFMFNMVFILLVIKFARFIIGR